MLRILESNTCGPGIAAAQPLAFCVTAVPVIPWFDSARAGELVRPLLRGLGFRV